MINELILWESHWQVVLCLVAIAIATGVFFPHYLGALHVEPQ